MKSAEEEIETLKQYIIDLKARIAVYIPVKGDTVDKRLAEYINNYPDRNKLKIMFMRESEGVYQFGSKKVAVKVEQDKIKVRVGGGYMSADEFIEQYGRIEILKAMKEAGDPDFEEARNSLANIGGRGRSGSNPRGSAKAYGMGEMRDLMKK